MTSNCLHCSHQQSTVAAIFFFFHIQCPKSKTSFEVHCLSWILLYSVHQSKVSSCLNLQVIAQMSTSYMPMIFLCAK
uniref:Uncharacterized protein n=1 Tax=Rhizophora mucronata TaxID=61149 RepID=A0A2P2P430_RHIMU